MNRSLSKGLAIAVLVAAVSGCASGVKRADESAGRPAYFAGGGRLAGDVTVSLNQEAQGKLADNLKFDQQKLLATVRRALEAKNLLAKAQDVTLPKIEIVVTDIRVRSTFSAVMWGFMAGNDTVSGEVIVRDPAGQDLQRFTVSASYALGGLAGGQEETRMNWLYETFAQHTVEELTGTGSDR